jgi:hypothetical protein
MNASGSWPVPPGPTIAKKESSAKDQVAGAIFGAGLSLKNTLLANNSAMWTPGCDSPGGNGRVAEGCDKSHTDEGGNLQSPSGALCAASITVADPQLGSPTTAATPRRCSPRPRAPRAASGAAAR